MELLNNCPLCNSTTLTSYIQSTDFTVSHEQFLISQCSPCGFRFTNPRPDSIEIARYYLSENYISHNDNTEGFINSIYHWVKTISLRQKVNFINTYIPQPNKKLLDFGCGTGDFLVAARDKGMDVTGVEPTELARRKAQNKVLSVAAYEEFFNYSKDSFDVITLWHVLEHVHDLKKVFNHLCLILKPGGFMFVALPNSNATDAFIYDRFWAAFDVPRHLYHFTPQTFKYFIKNFPVSLINKKAMPFDPFYISILSEKYKTGKSNYVTAFYNGLTGFISGNKEVDKASSIIYVLQRT